MHTHWSEHFVGLPWSNRRNCAWLVMHVLKEQFDRQIVLPRGIDWRRFTPDEARSVAGDIGRRVDDPQEGDGVLMKTIGDTVSPGSHVGLHCNVRGVPYVLHNWEKIGCLLTPAARLFQLQLEISGYYRWH